MPGTSPLVELRATYSQTGGRTEQDIADSVREALGDLLQDIRYGSKRLANKVTYTSVTVWVVPTQPFGLKEIEALADKMVALGALSQKVRMTLTRMRSWEETDG